MKQITSYITYKSLLPVLFGAILFGSTVAFAQTNVGSSLLERTFSGREVDTSALDRIDVSSFDFKSRIVSAQELEDLFIVEVEVEDMQVVDYSWSVVLDTLEIKIRKDRVSNPAELESIIAQEIQDILVYKKSILRKAQEEQDETTTLIFDLSALLGTPGDANSEENIDVVETEFVTGEYKPENRLLPQENPGLVFVGDISQTIDSISEEETAEPEQLTFSEWLALVEQENILSEREDEVLTVNTFDNDQNQEEEIVETSTTTEPIVEEISETQTEEVSTSTAVVETNDELRATTTETEIREEVATTTEPIVEEISETQTEEVSTTNQEVESVEENLTLEEPEEEFGNIIVTQGEDNLDDSVEIEE